MKPTLGLLACILLLGACNKPPAEPVSYGYVEGRMVQIAPIPSGRITALHVREGDAVTPGTPLFALDPNRAQTALDGARAALVAASARLADLQKAGRPEEIQAATQTLRQRESAVKLANENIARSQILVTKKLAPAARLDTDRATLEQAKAAVGEAKARLALLRQPARADQIVAQQAELSRLQAQIDRAQIDLDDVQVRALKPARVQTIYRRVGELTGPALPVLALLRPGDIRVRFFVPETRLAGVHPQMPVSLRCDGCPAGLSGKVSFIASQSEFTPPVIFTQKERSKLMWMIEVIPDDVTQFRLGQPVEVRW